jgi:hypothetical protein
LADRDVALMLESMMGVAARAGHLRTRPGPSDPAMRKARVCYDHMAGEMGVRLFDSLVAQRTIANRRDTIEVTREGRAFLAAFGIDLDALATGRRPLCKSCLDWSQRRTHLAGSLGGALLDRIYALDWAARDKKTRTLHFSPRGERSFITKFRLPD